MRKSTLLMGAAALALFFILLQDMRSTPEERNRKSQYIYNIDSREVQEVTVFKDGNEYVKLLRTGEQDWNITFPIQASASEYSIAPLMNFINDAMYTNIYSKDSYENYSLEEFGLENPPYRVVFQAEGTQYAFRISQVKGDDVYILKEDNLDRVLVAPRHFYNYFSTDINEYRIRTVFSFNDVNVTRIEIKGETNLSVSKPTQGIWTIETPFRWPGAPDMIAVYMNALKALRVDEFIKDNATPEELKTYGILDTSARVILHFSYTDPVAIIIGKQTDDKKKFYFTIEGSSSVFSAAKNHITPLIAPEVKLFRNRKLGVFDPELIRNIEVVYSGKEDALKFERATLSSPWKCLWPEDERVGTERINDYISAFTETRIVNFTMEGKDKIPVFDLDKPDIIIVFSGVTGPGKNEEIYRLLLKNKGKNLIYGYIKGTDSILRLPEKLFNDLNAGLKTFKSLYILPEIEQKFSWFAITGKNRVRVEGKVGEGRTWEIIEPTNKRPVAEEINEMISMLSLLRADSIVTLKIDNYRKYGLDDPDVTVSFVADGHKFGLLIGSKVPGSTESYVKLTSSEAVFTLSKEKIDSIAKDTWNLIKLK